MRVERGLSGGSQRLLGIVCGWMDVWPPKCEKGFAFVSERKC